MTYQDPDDEPQLSDAFKAEADKLLEIANGTENGDGLEDMLRKLGLYNDHAHIAMIDTPMGPKPALIVDCTIGDVAWTDRVQHPENYGIDQQFRAMEVEIVDSDFEDAKVRMRRNVAAGRDPLDDGDDE